MVLKYAGVKLYLYILYSRGDTISFIFGQHFIPVLSDQFSCMPSVCVCVCVCVCVKDTILYTHVVLHCDIEADTR
jgi:hypothetical protein